MRKPGLSLLAALLLAAWASVAGAQTPPTGSAYRLGPLQFLGDEPRMLDVGAGAYNFLRRGPGKGNRISAEGRLEVRFGPKLFSVGPAVGVLANADGGVFAYAGMYTDLRYRRFIVTPLLGLGGYSRGHSKHLGGVFQFRLSVTVSYEFANRSRLGLTFAHISNSSIHARNPSEQELLLSYAIPF